MFKKIAIGLFLAAFCLGARAADTNSIVWHRATDCVDADVRSMALWPLLEKIAVDAGWHIFVEPDITHATSAKFKNLPSGEALKRLLGDLNFALVPQTNGLPQLYVFRTVMKNATQPVLAPKSAARHVANELLVKLKPGTDADALAKSLGAKITGRNDKLGLYRFLFGDAAATDAALGQLKGNSDVATVDYDYIYDVPTSAQRLAGAATGPVSLTLNPTGDSGKVVVGLIDTPVQSLDASLAQFLLKQLSVTGDSYTTGSDPTHGTAMAETILRALAAIDGSTSAQILPVNVYSSGETTTSWDVALGIQMAVDNGATVLNLSLGGAGGQFRSGQHHPAGHCGGHSRFCGGGQQLILDGNLSGSDLGRHCRHRHGRHSARVVCELRQLCGPCAVGHEHRLSERRGLPGAGHVSFHGLCERRGGGEQVSHDGDLGADPGGDAEKIHRPVEMSSRVLSPAFRRFGPLKILAVLVLPQTVRRIPSRKCSCAPRLKTCAMGMGARRSRRFNVHCRTPLKMPGVPYTCALKRRKRRAPPDSR